MKKHFALVDSNGVIRDTLEVSHKEVLLPAIPGLTWQEVKTIDKNFHKDPEKFSVDKEKIKIRSSIELVVSSDKVFVGDTVTITVEFKGIKKSDLPVMINVDGQDISVDDKDSINLTLQHEGTYKIYSNDPRFYCNLIHIDAVQTV